MSYTDLERKFKKCVADLNETEKYGEVIFVKHPTEDTKGNPILKIKCMGKTITFVELKTHYRILLGGKVDGFGQIKTGRYSYVEPDPKTLEELLDAFIVTINRLM